MCCLTTLSVSQFIQRHWQTRGRVCSIGGVALTGETAVLDGNLTAVLDGNLTHLLSVSHKSYKDWPGIEIGSSRWQTCGDRVTTRRVYVAELVGTVSSNMTVAAPGHSTACLRLCTSLTRWLQPAHGRSVTFSCRIYSQRGTSSIILSCDVNF
jgi:hypothetical protein